MDIWLPLFVAVPLTVAALCVVAPWKGLRSALFLITPLAGIIAGLSLFSYTSKNGAFAHNVGLYVGGVSIPFAADAFTAVFITTTAIVILAANLFALGSGETRARFYPALTMMLMAGVNGALLTADLFNLFVFVEVMLLPSYGLMAMTGTKARLAAGRTFVLSNLLASTMLLIGVGFIYGVAGTVNLPALAGAAHGNGPTVVAFGLVIIALATKAGVFPLHTWLPRTYPATSPAVMGLFSALHTKVAVYAIFRIFVVAFDYDVRWDYPIVIIMIISMLLGSFAGLAEHTMRRILAYQMVTGMPFILVMLAFTNFDPQRALAAGLFYTVHHMITVGSLILTAGAVEETYGTGTLRRLSGLARRDPLVAGIFAAGAFSVVGFPPFSGMWGKVFIVMEIARSADWKAWAVIAAIILASLGALLSMLRLWREVFWGAPAKQYPPTLVVPLTKVIPGAALLACSVLMFFFAGPLIDAMMTAASALLNVSDYQGAVLGDVSTAIGVVNDPLQGAVN